MLDPIAASSPDASLVLYDEPFAAIVRAAGERLEATLARETPALATRVLPWLASLSRSGRLADYYMHPRRFPMLLIPWWAVEGTASRDDLGFHEDLAYSTMSGYCFVRLLDDLVDQRGEPGLDLLPAAGVFHLEFQSPYQRYFPGDHPFWDLFRSRWLRAADATVPASPDRSPGLDLEQRAADTLGPALIPLAAACHHAGRPALFDRWRPVVLALARLEQFMDDLLDWQHDEERHQPNLVLEEAARRARTGENATAWVVRQGYVWALDTAAERIEMVAAEAGPLASGGLRRFLDVRRSVVNDFRSATAPGLRQLAELGRLFEPPPG